MQLSAPTGPQGLPPTPRLLLPAMRILLLTLGGLSLACTLGCGPSAGSGASPTQSHDGSAATAGPGGRSEGPGAKGADPLILWKNKLASPDPDVRSEAVASLADLARGSEADAAIKLLIAALADPQATIVRQARVALTLLGPVVVPPVSQVLESESSEQRLQAATILSDLAARALPAAPALIKHLDDTDLNVRTAVAAALEKMGEPVVLPLAGELAAESAARRLQAARVLRNLGPTAQAAVPALVEALKDEDPDVHVAVASALYVVDPEAAQAAGVQ